jgi:hypothetical protein
MMPKGMTQVRPDKSSAWTNLGEDNSSNLTGRLLVLVCATSDTVDKTMAASNPPAHR